jgi:hypothetical protein
MAVPVMPIDLFRTTANHRIGYAMMAAKSADHREPVNTRVPIIAVTAAAGTTTHPPTSA